MDVLCVIPARGGSKGIPRKNLVQVAGRPLIGWTIEQALATTHPMDVVVSTDDEEIAVVAGECGARVVRRPLELAQDSTPTEPVVLHALDDREQLIGPVDAVMLLQATSPVRLPGTIDRAIEQFTDGQYDAVVGVIEQPPFIWRAGEPPQADYPVDARPRRQDLTDAHRRYRESGSLYVTRPAIYREEQNRLGGRIGLFVMDEREGIDIDTEVDRLTAEYTLRAIAIGLR